MVWVLLSLYIPSGSTLGRLASPFTINLIDEKELRLKDLRKNVVFLNFWASWCTPCKAEARGLEAAWRKSKKRDVVFLGINIQDDQAEDALRYLKNHGITYPTGWDDGSIARTYSVWGIPKSFIISPEGTITYIHMGTMSSATMTAKIGEARKGVVTVKEGRGLFESLKVIRIDELARLLEKSRNTGTRPVQKSSPKEEYRRINVHEVSAHRGQWVKILLKDGAEREGKVLKVKEDVIQLEQRFSAGSFSIQVPMGQVGEVHLLIFKSRADVRK